MRSVWGCIPTSSEATLIMYRGRSSIDTPPRQQDSIADERGERGRQERERSPALRVDAEQREQSDEDPDDEHEAGELECGQPSHDTSSNWGLSERGCVPSTSVKPYSSASSAATRTWPLRSATFGSDASATTARPTN